MPKYKLLLIISGILLLIAGVAFGIGEIKTTAKPVAECVPEGQPTSGFMIEKEDGTECKVSSKYVKDLRAYEWPPHKRPMRFVTAGAVLAAIILSITSLVMFLVSKRKAKKAQATKQAE